MVGSDDVVADRYGSCPDPAPVACETVLDDRVAEDLGPPATVVHDSGLVVSEDEVPFDVAISIKGVHHLDADSVVRDDIPTDVDEETGIHQDPYAPWDVSGPPAAPDRESLDCHLTAAVDV